MLSRQDIKWLQVEATTKCNAWCPGCARNNNGYGIAPGFVLEDLSIRRLEQVLEYFPNLDVVHFCGTFGDAIAAQQIFEMIDLSKKHCKKIQLNTNGSLRSVAWWKSFALLLSDFDHDVWFCLDGLNGVHEIYRQGTEFNTVVSNAQSFINAGGHASWQFIPWAHNEHQLKDCMKLSQQLGFKHFRFIKNARTNFQARHYRTGELLEIKPWSKNSSFSRFAQFQSHVPLGACMHLTQPSVYLNANGSLSSCCWINLSNTFEKFDQLPDIQQELETQPNSMCLKFCGVSCA